MYLNKAFIIGNLTRDPEVKALPSGTKVTNFSVATNRIFKDKDGTVDLRQLDGVAQKFTSQCKKK